MEHNVIEAIIAAVVLLFESWLGKTDKVKAGSTLELLKDVAVGAIGAFKKK